MSSSRAPLQASSRGYTKRTPLWMVREGTLPAKVSDGGVGVDPGATDHALEIAAGELLLMDAAQYQKAADPSGPGAGDIGAQGIPDRQDAPPVGDGEKAEAGVVDRPVRLAEILHPAPQLLIALGDRAGADLRASG